MQVLTTAPPASHAYAHHGAVLSFSPQVRIAPAPGSQASGTWYVDPVLRLWHAPDGLARHGRLVKAERVAVSTSAQVEPLEGDSVRRDEHLQAEPLDGDSVSLSVLTTAPAPLPHRWSRWRATRFR